MKRKHIVSAMFIFTIFIVADLNILAEAHLEHKPEYLEDPDISEDQDNSIEKVIVDKNNGNAKYTSIQKAIEEVQPGVTIYVKVGIYDEILDIHKQIYLVGENKEYTLITPLSEKNSYAVQITANNVELSGFSISNKGPGLYTTGIKLIADNTIIRECDIFDTPVGIAIWSSENSILNCNFWGCTDEGIAFLGSPYTDCNNNVVEDCEFYNNCDGIELQYSSNNLISNCEFYDNTHAGIDAIASRNNDNTIQNCKIYDNLGFGIYFSRSSGNELRQCSLSNNKIMAISSQYIVRECNFDTIFLMDDSSIVIENCENLDESKIKTIDSEFQVKGIERVEDGTLAIQKEENYKHQIITTILRILNNIRSRFRNSLQNHF